jgi:SAM-dependent methyltransferase
MNSICPLCDSSKFKSVGRPKTNSISKNFIDNDYKVVQCLNCDVYYVSPRISFSEEQWSKLYNNEYFSSQSDWLIKKRAEELSQRFDKASKYLKGDKISFLDVGCGEGKSLIEGFKRDWEVTGIDIVDNRIEAAKTGNGNFIVGNFIDQKFPKNHFDFIYLDSVLEHVLNPKEYLLKIKEILKIGGVCYIGVPNEDSLFNIIRKIVFTLLGRNDFSVKIKPFDNPYHIIGFNEKSLKYILNELDLEIVYMRNFGRKFDFLSHTPNQRGYWIGLFFLLPIEFIGNMFNKDVYYELLISKKAN